MHVNIVKGDMVIGYAKEDFEKYKEKVKELNNSGFVLTDTDYSPNGDCHEMYEKGHESFLITHLAI